MARHERSGRLRQTLAQLPTRVRREQGSVALEAAITGLIGITLIMLVLQGWMYYAAGNTARSAAQAGLQAARVEDGSAAAGRTAALSNANAVGGIANLAVSASRSGTNARVTVTGNAPTVLPGIPLPAIHAEAGGPVERTTR